MALFHVLLGLLSRGDSHGYDLKRRYDARFPAARPLAFGQVYTALDGLTRRGWIDSGAPVKAGAAERTVFALTPEGRAELDRWLDEVEPPAPHAGNPLQVKVTIALLVSGPQAASGYLSAQRSAHLVRMRDYTRVVNEPGRAMAEVLAADYALTHLEADLKWIEAAQTRVGRLADELDAEHTPHDPATEEQRS